MPMPYCPRCGKDHPNCLCWGDMSRKEIASAIASNQGEEGFDNDDAKNALARIMRGNTKGLMPRKRK